MPETHVPDTWSSWGSPKDDQRSSWDYWKAFFLYMPILNKYLSPNMTFSLFEYDIWRQMLWAKIPISLFKTWHLFIGWRMSLPSTNYLHLAASIVVCVYTVTLIICDSLLKRFVMSVRALCLEFDKIVRSSLKNNLFIHIYCIIQKKHRERFTWFCSYFLHKIQSMSGIDVQETNMLYH